MPGKHMAAIMADKWWPTFYTWSYNSSCERSVIVYEKGSRKGERLISAWKCFMAAALLPECPCVFGKCFQKETHISAHSQYSSCPACFPSASSWVLHTAATSRRVLHVYFSLFSLFVSVAASAQLTCGTGLCWSSYADVRWGLSQSFGLWS